MTSKFGSDLFIDRHLGLGDNDEKIMLNKLGFNNIEQFLLDMEYKTCTTSDFREHVFGLL